MMMRLDIVIYIFIQHIPILISQITYFNWYTELTENMDERNKKEKTLHKRDKCQYDTDSEILRTMLDAVEQIG